ncbi:hypothetical protein [Micromonospora inositola]|nr:hypothetical protein [Micromonospora inositola]
MLDDGPAFDSFQDGRLTPDATSAGKAAPVRALARWALLVLTAAACLLALNPAPALAASAVTYFPTSGQLCADEPILAWELCPATVSVGHFTWYNRTTSIEGYLWNETGFGSGKAAVIFEAYAGSTKVNTFVTTKLPAGGVGSPGMYYAGSVGDTNRVGGINRIKTTVCFYWTSGDVSCGANHNEYRPF